MLDPKVSPCRCIRKITSRFLLIRQLLWKVVYFISPRYNLVDTYSLRPILREHHLSGFIFNRVTRQVSCYVTLCYRWILKTDTVKVTVQEGNTEVPDGSLVIFGYDVSGRVTSEEEAVSGVTFVLFGVRYFFRPLLLSF